MSAHPSGNDLVTAAAAGNREALEQLVFELHGRLSEHVAPKLLGPRGLVEGGDAVQEAYVSAFRDIDSIRATDVDGFYRWLVGIADHRLVDLLRARAAAKRGGGRAGVRRPSDGGASTDRLVDAVAIDPHTPSRAAA